MVRKIFLAVLFLVLVIPAGSWAHAGKGNVVDVRIISDHGAEFVKHRFFPRLPQDGSFFYVEAVKGDRYSIEVTNRSDRRIGVVIAVDGRNIINGKRSELNSKEQMYILGPRESNTFEGWRTGMDRTNRFYFTESSDSYADKVFGDVSAMGTVALAVYKEKLPEITLHSQWPLGTRDVPGGALPQDSSKSRSSDRVEAKKGEEAGTGFGETTYSPARVVHFDPEHIPAEKIVMKYEWRSELCRKGVLRCGPKNRFWPDEPEFAPIPKDFRG